MNGKCLIELNGLQIGLRFGMPANRWFFEALENEPDNLIGTQLSERGIAELLYAGYRNHRLVVDSDAMQPLSLGFFVEAVDEAALDPAVQEQITTAVNCYSESAYTKKYLEQTNLAIEELQKKTSTGTKLSALPMQTSDLRQNNGKPARSKSSPYAGKAGKLNKKSVKRKK